MPLIEKNVWVKYLGKSHKVQIWYSNKHDRMFYFKFEDNEGLEDMKRLITFGFQNHYHSSKQSLLDAWGNAHQKFLDSQGSWSNVIDIKTEIKSGYTSGFSLKYEIYAVKTYEDGRSDIYRTRGESLEPGSRMSFYSMGEREKLDQRALPYSESLHQFLDRIKMEIDILAIRFEEFMKSNDLEEMALTQADIFSRLLQSNNSEE